ncbi:MAG: response regulator [Calditrichaeota bacterium]|nr:MAG: response regulator [Calditrichota bacterium]MBL1207382.1 response regulator [Calditrichota bacterium]NOG47214.1 response regulator [Calditrichota bacterium]
MQKILIADDNEEMLDTLVRIFGLYDFEVIKALDGKEAITAAEQNIPDIIILDGMMPIMDGFEACQILKQKKATKEIPVVFLTANFMELRDRIKGLELGADDYLLKPFNSKELVARIKSIIKRTETTKKLREDNQQLINKNSLIEDEFKKLLESKKNVEQNPVTDSSTGLYKFDLFKDQVENELQRSLRFSNDLSLILISFDNLIKIKDSLGSQLYNYFVIKIANFILNQTRTIDIVSFNEKTGFYILLPQTDFDGANAKAANIKETLKANKYIDEEILKTLEFSKKKLSDISKLSFKFGVSSNSKDDSIAKADDLLQIAEKALGELPEN